MRSLVTGFSVFLFFLTGTSLLGALVAHQTVLDASRVGDVVGQALSDPELKSKIVGKLVPGYAGLTNADKATLQVVTDNDGFEEAGRGVTFDESSSDINFQPLEKYLITELRSAGERRLARMVAQRDSLVEVDTKDMQRYRNAQDITSRMLLLGGIVTALLLVVAVACSKRRLITGRSLAIAVLIAAGLVGALYWVLPSAARGLSSSGAAQFGAALIEAGRPAMLWILLPVLALSAAVIVLATVLSRSSPVTHEGQSGRARGAV